MSVLPERILLATDGSEDAERASMAALDLALRSGTELHVVHVWHDVRGFAHDFVKRELRRRGQEVLDGQVVKIEAAGGEVARAHLRGGRTSNQVIALGKEIGAGLLVVGNRGLGTVRRILMGSQSEEIVHHAQVPVLVLGGADGSWPPERIVIGEDFSDDALKAGELAAAIGKLYGAGGLIVYSHPDLPEIPPGETRSAVRNLVNMRERDEKMLDDRASGLERFLGSKPEVRLSGDYPAKVLLDAAQEVRPTLIAVGSRGRAGITRTRLGSVSTKVVTAAQGPVLVYPHVDQSSLQSV
jgi:nucleotide-binding universal stress UspA family protein